MNYLLALVLGFFTCAAAWAGGAAAPKGSPDWKVEVVAEQPTVNYCSVVCCAPDGRVFLAEDPMDMIGPPNQPIDRILCLHPDGKITVFADKLYAVFGLVYMDGKLYVHHSPKFSVFEDGGAVGKNRVDLIDCTHPKPWGGMNDHIPSNFRLGVDGWFYMSTGDKGIYGAVGKDGSKAEIHGGGVMRFRPDGTKLEVFCTGTRNHLDVALNAEDEMFTYDNTDDGNGWWTRLTHMVDGGFYGYPYDYKPQRPYTLWMMGDYGGGSPTGSLAYNEDALPREYHGNLFMCEWGKGQIARFIVERDGGSFKIVSRDNLLTKGTKDFRPVGIAVSADGMSLYIADWNFGGWSNRSVKAGRLIKATYTGKSQAAPKPTWFVPAALGQPFKATTAELVEGLSHPAQSVRLVAMRRVAERGAESVPMLEKLLQDVKAPAYARWTALWTLDRLDEGKISRAKIIAALADSDPSLRRQAARQLGTRAATDAGPELVKLLKDQDRSVRFHAATALGRIGDSQFAGAVMLALDDNDLFARYAAITALNRMGRADPKAWRALATGLILAAKPYVRERILFAFRETYDVNAVQVLVSIANNREEVDETRAVVLALLGELSQQRPAWKSEWWGTQPVRTPPPARSVAWEGTKPAFAALRKGLKDSEPLVRQGAARGMIASDSPQMSLELLEHLPAEKDLQVAKEMLQSLSHARNTSENFTRAANQLAAKLLQDGSMIPEALAFAANLSAVTPELTAAVMKLSARDLPADQQLALLETLARSRDAAVVPAISARLQHPDAAVRTRAVQLLTGRPDAEVGQALTRMLGDKVPAVRKEAAISLGKRKDRSAIPPLLQALKDREVRFDAINALAQMPDARAADAYLEGMASKNNQQRDLCTKAVASLNKDALPAIEARLGRKPALSAAVVLQLQKIYKGVPQAKDSPLFSIAAKEIRVEDFAAAAATEKGNAQRGRKIFFDAKGSACIKCHRIGKEGGEVGPDLSGIGLKYNRNQLIENVLYPSKQILDGYEVTVIETRAGLTINGIVRAESGDDLTLIDAEGKKHTIKKKEIETRVKSANSIMPDGVQMGLTISEFADLIDYLETLKEKTPTAPPSKTSLDQGILREKLPGVQERAEAGDAKKPAPPAAPREFAFVLSVGYGEGDPFSNDPKVFENLLINMRKSGFNTIHCVYRDWRLELCRKHNVKMMIDVLAWKEGAGTDIRKPEQREAVQKFCMKLRGDDAVWGYNLWNETLSFFGNPDGKNVDAYIAMLKEWDPTHPVWLGTRTVSYANAPKQKPGVHGYYDYPWQRGFLHHFADLQWYYRYVPSQDGFIGRWEQGSNYNWNSYSLNTSIAFGTKVTIWFIGGPFDKEGNIDPKHRFHHLVKIGQETQQLYPELGKLGRPSEVFSTPTTKTHDNKPRDRTKDKDDVPWRLTAFPKDFWFRVESGEVLAGFFQYPSGDDAVFVANHNAFVRQEVVLSLAEDASNKDTRLEILDRETGRWQMLTAKDGRFAFELRPGGGELLRVQGRTKRAAPK